MFWIGQLLALVAGLLGVALFRTLVRKRLRKASEHQLDVTLVALLVIGLFISVWQYLDSNATVNSLTSEIATLREYSTVARLTFNGSEIVKGDIKQNTRLTGILEGTYYEVSPDRFRKVCSNDALARFRQAMQEFPQFPFSYYWLALCLQEKGDPNWITYAREARSIFERTTRISGHHESHDEALRTLHELLK